MVISRVKVPRVCAVEGCGGKILAKGYCCKHYYQVKRNGCVGTKRGSLRRTAEGGHSRGVDLSLLGGRASGRHRCAVRGCPTPLFDGQFCRLHFIKMRYLGMIGIEAGDVAEDEAGTGNPWELLEGTAADLS